MNDLPTPGHAAAAPDRYDEGAGQLPHGVVVGGAVHFRGRSVPVWSPDGQREIGFTVAYIDAEYISEHGLDGLDGDRGGGERDHDARPDSDGDTLGHAHIDPAAGLPDAGAGWRLPNPSASSAHEGSIRDLPTRGLTDPRPSVRVALDAATDTGRGEV
jgi:hypothetical protein